jgi:UDP-2,3-diacylglucosamine pyrophosphatase LpxH
MLRITGCRYKESGPESNDSLSSATRNKDVAMLVIISDLHLTDGSSGASIPPGAFMIFAERLRELAFSASWRSSGGYKPIDRIDLVLLGDGLDVIRSGRWSLRREIRPWGNPHDPELVATVTKITTDILHYNGAALQVLRGLANENSIRLPPANNRAQPVFEGEGQPVQVKIHYMVGNHDWFFHLPGASYDALRELVIRHMGLCNRADQPFPHAPHESDELIEAQRRHRVCARHGDVYDPFNFEGDRDASSLGDAIVIDLLNRFSGEVESELAADLPDITLAGLREIDNVRPSLLVPIWVDGLLERSCSFPSLRKRVKKVWDRLADEFLDLKFVRERDTWSPNDLVDGLQRALKFSQRISVGWASSVIAWMHQMRGPGEGSYYQHALTEQDFRNRRAMHIIYGHTHDAESIPLDASFAEGYVFNQVYFNSGTWRRVHRQTMLAPGEHEFIPSDVMTYLAFYRGDERGGRPYETWSGTLGMCPADNSVHRVDPGTENVSYGQHVSASNVPINAPHFAASPAKAGQVPSRRIG